MREVITGGWAYVVIAAYAACAAVARVNGVKLFAAAARRAPIHERTSSLDAPVRPPPHALVHAGRADRGHGRACCHRGERHQQNLVYYWTPADLRDAGDKAYGATIRLGGMVAGRLDQEPRRERPASNSTSRTPARRPRQDHRAPPQMFRENIGVVVEGTMMRGGYFQSNRLMVSHSNEYKAPEKGHPSTRRARQLMKSTDGLTSKPVAGAINHDFSDVSSFWLHCSISTAGAIIAFAAGGAGRDRVASSGRSGSLTRSAS